MLTTRNILILFFTDSTAPLGPGLWFFSFMIILQTVGLLGRVISLSQGLYLNTGQHKHRINTYTYQTSVPCVSPSERAKTVHALDSLSTVTGHINTTNAVSSICDAPFSDMCSTQADSNSRKLRLRCGCQFPWCILALRILVCVQR
jgi:hypothetical protein